MRFVARGISSKGFQAKEAFVNFIKNNLAKCTTDAQLNEDEAQDHSSGSLEIAKHGCEYSLSQLLGRLTEEKATLESEGTFDAVSSTEKAHASHLDRLSLPATPLKSR